jgi:hypothetical protein
VKVTDGLSTICFRVTSTYFYQVAYAPQQNSEYDSESSSPAAESSAPSLADTGANLSQLGIWMMVLIGAAVMSLVFARRRDS